MPEVLPADDFPGAECCPLEYPGPRPAYSYLYYQHRVYPLTPDAENLSASVVYDGSGLSTIDGFLAQRGAAPLQARHAVLAVGSNGCPGRLAEKYNNMTSAAIPVFVGAIRDLAVVYSRSIVGYGALPSTYVLQPGASSRPSVTMLSDEELALMEETEPFYKRVSVSGALQVDLGPNISSLTAYLDRKILSVDGTPILVKAFATGSSAWPSLDESAVLSLVMDRAGIHQGLPIADRHRLLVSDKATTDRLQSYLDKAMSSLAVDHQGRIAPRGGESK